jgi:hypothetical protein
VDDAASYTLGFANSSENSIFDGAALCVSESPSCDAAMPRCLPADQEVFVEAFGSDGELLSASDKVDVPSDVGSLEGVVVLDDNVRVEPISSSKLNVSWVRADEVSGAHPCVDRNHRLVVPPSASMHINVLTATPHTHTQHDQLIISEVQRTPPFRFSPTIQRHTCRLR